MEKIANQIEVKLYNLHGDINTKYKTKYRSLLFNLKDTKNQVVCCLFLLPHVKYCKISFKICVVL